MKCISIRGAGTQTSKSIQFYPNTSSKWCDTDDTNQMIRSQQFHRNNIKSHYDERQHLDSCYNESFIVEDVNPNPYLLLSFGTLLFCLRSTYIWIINHNKLTFDSFTPVPESEASSRWSLPRKDWNYRRSNSRYEWQIWSRTRRWPSFAFQDRRRRIRRYTCKAGQNCQGYWKCSELNKCGSVWRGKLTIFFPYF